MDLIAYKIGIDTESFIVVGESLADIDNYYCEIGDFISNAEFLGDVILTNEAINSIKKLID